MAMIGLVAVASLGEFASELRAGSRAVEARVLQALTEDRQSALSLVPAEVLARLPDSLSAGVFPAPFSDYRWSADARSHREIQGLFDINIVISSKKGELALATRIFRPAPHRGRSQR
jgi:hypothetical protein